MALPLAQIPSYEITLPISKTKLKFRPFLVREEKLLLIAMQEDDPRQISSAVRQILENCTFGKISLNTLSQVDIEYLFVSVRNKSMTEALDIISTCIQCGEQNRMQLDFSKIEVEYPKKEVANPVKIGEKMWVKMRHPNLDLVYEIKMDNNPDNVFLLLSKCIESVIDEDSVYSTEDQSEDEVVEWLEGLSSNALQNMKEFMNSIPKLVLRDEFKCEKCGYDNIIYLDGLKDFFE